MLAKTSRVEMQGEVLEKEKMKVNGCNLAKRGSWLTGQLKAARMWLAKGLEFCFQSQHQCPLAQFA